MKTETICFTSAVKLREILSSQEISAVELTEIFIERIEKKNPKVNAYCTPTFDVARQMAKEADKRELSGEKIPKLNGIPTSVKDLMCTKGILTTFGNKIYKDFIPEEDAEAVKRLKNAGIVILGKTNTPNFGYGGGKTDNMIFGLSKNPWNLSKTTGGSSGGAAAAVAAGLSPLALASDGGGSIRHPATLCGVYGLKANRGRVSTYQNTPLKSIPGFHTTHYGPITRYVEDAALMLDVLKGPYALDSHTLPAQPGSYLESLKTKPDKLKIALSLNLGYVKLLDKEVEKAVRNAASLLSGLDWSVEEPKLKIKNPEPPMTLVWSSLYAAQYSTLYKKHPDAFEPQLARLIEAGMNISSVEFLKTQIKSKKFFVAIAKLLQEYDILLTPTIATIPFDNGKMFPDQIDGKNISPTGWMPFTFPFNLTGHPAATIPVGFSESGLPIGMQIVGRMFDETTVLQVSKAMQDLLPWQNIFPPIS